MLDNDSGTLEPVAMSIGLHYYDPRHGTTLGALFFERGTASRPASPEGRSRA